MADSGLTGFAALTEKVQAPDCYQRALIFSPRPAFGCWRPGVDINVLTG
jgi:hypothetical protein